MSSQLALGKRNVAVLVVAAVVAVAVSIGLASAAPSPAYAAGKTSVWVVTAKKNSDEYRTWKSTYKYTTNGLVKNRKFLSTYEGENGYTSTETYTYDSKNRLKSRTSKNSGGSSFKATYTLDSKGRVVKLTEKIPGSTSSYKASYKYNSKGRLVKSVGYYGTVSKYTYNGKGQVKSTKDTGDEASDPMAYKYDSKGQIVEAIQTGYGTFSYKNTYKSGRLAKQKVYMDKELYATHTFSYKKVSVPSSLVKMVKAQQESIIKDILPLEAAHK